jgi:hypothetical protein
LGLPDFQAPITDQASLDKFLWNHWIETQELLQKIQSQLGVSLLVRPLQTMDSHDIEGWLQREQETHNDFNAVLNVPGTDLQDVDFKNARSVEEWLYREYQEHSQARYELAKRAVPISIYQSGQASLVFVGASVCWGLGNDISQQYTTLIQNKINTTVGVQLAGWPARNVHTDDYQPGGSETTSPFNAGPTNEGPNWGTGTIGSKLTAGATLPLTAAVEIYTGYLGGKTVAGAGIGIYTDPAIRMRSGSSIAFSTNAPSYLGLSLVSAATGANGEITVTSSWHGVEAVIDVTAKNQISSILFPLSPITGVAPYTLTISNADNTKEVDIVTIWPGALQATNHILVQVVARDSYCIEDYLGSQLMPDGSSALVTDLIKQSVVNSAAYSTSSTPWYVIFDTYNNFISAGSLAAPSAGGDRRLTPSQYTAKLLTLGQALSTGTNGGNIILTTPAEPGLPPSTLNGPSAGPLPNSNFGSGGGFAFLTGFRMSDYATAINELANAQGWLYVDQSVIPSLVTPAFFWPDGIHPQPTGAQMIASKFISVLGL